jgi:tetraacyldisaccharide 4'-kinase
MRPPDFWNAEVSGRDAALALRALLRPLAWAYAWGVAQRQRNTVSRHAPIPVLCVGNLTLGGAGKTPVTRAIRAKLGPYAHTLSRGYGGRLPGPLRVTPDMVAAEVGDEPLLHASDGPAWIRDSVFARDRLAGALAAAQAGAHAIVMDDGFQNPALAKTLSLIVVDPEFGIGNGEVFPAGPLRERLHDGLRRADAVVMLYNSPPPQDGAVPDWLAEFDKPILRARLAPVGAPPPGKLLAFAGLARPEKFFDTLVNRGAQITDCAPYPDHHPYSNDDLAFLTRMAEEQGAALITTEKDAARLSPEWRARVAVLPVSAQFEDEAALSLLLAPIRAAMSAHNL